MCMPAYQTDFNHLICNLCWFIFCAFGFFRLACPPSQRSFSIICFFKNVESIFLIYPACSLSELSSLHEGDTNFRQTYRNVQKKALPTIPDQDSCPEPDSYHENRSPDLQHHRKNPSSPHRYRHNPDSDHHDSQDQPLLPRRYSDDPPSLAQSHRMGRNQRQQHSSDEDKHDRCRRLWTHE